MEEREEGGGGGDRRADKVINYDVESGPRKLGGCANKSGGGGRGINQPHDYGPRTKHQINQAYTRLG